MGSFLPGGWGVSLTGAVMYCGGALLRFHIDYLRNLKTRNLQSNPGLVPR